MGGSIFRLWFPRSDLLGTQRNGIYPKVSLYFLFSIATIN